MVRTFAFAALIAVTAGLGVARAEDCGAITADEVRAAQQARYDAQTGDDFAAMDRLVGDDLVYIHSSAAVDDKTSYIESMRSGTVKYRRMQILDSKIRIYDCLALITGTAQFDVTVKGQDLTVDLRFTEGWTRRHGGLEFVSWQATRIPQQ